MTTLKKENIAALVLAGIAIGIWMIVFNIRPVQDPDIWWHLASGRYMVQHGVIPITDVFSLTARGTSWVNTYWLQDIFSYLLVRAGGLHALTFLNATAVAALVSLIACSNPAGDLPWAARLSGIVWIFLAGQPRGYGWGEKASLVTFGMLGLLFHTLRARDWTIRKGWLAVWPILFMLWSNLHRGFFLGLVIMSAYVLGAWQTKPADGKRLALWWAACVAATFLNPWGIHLYGMGWQDLRLSPINVTGWAQTPFFHLELFWLTLVVFWIALGDAHRKNQLPGFGFLVTSILLSLLSIRYASFYRYFVAWAVPWFLMWVSSRIRPLQWTALLPWTFAAMAVASIYVRPAFGINERIFPVNAVQFLIDQNLRAPFFHEYDLGGYYLWALDGHPPVLIDGRYPAVQGYQTLLPEIQQALQGTPPEFHRFLDRRAIHAAVVKYPSVAYLPSPFSLYFPRREWALIYWDDVVLIFVQRIPAFRKVIESCEFPTIEPDADPAYWKSTVWDHASLRQRDRMRGEFERNAERDPESRKARHWLDIIS